jgi:hypothetical protein
MVSTRQLVAIAGLTLLAAGAVAVGPLRRLSHAGAHVADDFIEVARS